MLTWPLPGNGHAHDTTIAALGQVSGHPSAGAGHTEMTSPERSCVGMAALTTHSVSRCFCRHLVCSVPVLRGRPVQCAYTLTHTLVLPCSQASTTPPSTDLPGLGAKGQTEASRKGVSA